MKRIVFAVLFLSAATGASNAQDDFSGTYFCTDEFGGGLSYNEERRAWRSTTFNPSGRYVFTLDKQGDDDTTPSYYVQVSEMGKDARRCYGKGQFSTQPVRLDFWDDTISCTTGLTEFKISPGNLRFLNFYPSGFIEGIDNNENTPWMMGGSCAKIDQ